MKCLIRQYVNMFFISFVQLVLLTCFVLTEIPQKPDDL